MSHKWVRVYNKRMLKKLCMDNLTKYPKVKIAFLNNWYWAVMEPDCSGRFEYVVIIKSIEELCSGRFNNVEKNLHFNLADIDERVEQFVKRKDK